MIEIFTVSSLDKLNDEYYLYNIFPCFSICDDGKLYVFYRLYYRSYSGNIIFDYLHDIDMVTICIETMTIISNQKLTENLKYGTGGDMTQKESIKTTNLQGIMFEELFFLKKAKKCFIKICPSDELVLVFDVKNQYFYFAENIFPKPEKTLDDIEVKYTVDNDDMVYVYKCYRFLTSVYKHEEIKTFKYCNEKLVESGIKCNYSIDSKKTEVESICVV